MSFLSSTKINRARSSSSSSPPYLQEDSGRVESPKSYQAPGRRCVGLTDFKGCGFRISAFRAWVFRGFRASRVSRVVGFGRLELQGLGFDVLGRQSAHRVTSRCPKSRPLSVP